MNNMYFKVRCVMYYSTLLTIIVFIFFLNTSDELDKFEYERNLESFTSANSKAMTKSLSDLGKMDEMNPYMLFMNFVPNCGGEFLILLMQKLQGLNNYRHVRLKKSVPQLSSFEEADLVTTLFGKMREKAIPLSFDKSVYFVNFTKYDKQYPTHINIIRDPIKKIYAKSHYGKESSLLKCVQMKRKCTIAEEVDEFNIPYFCGQDPRCRGGNSEWALQTAKNNVAKYYPVVGVLEDLNRTLQVLENEIPYFFNGVTDLYKNKLSGILKLDAHKMDQSKEKMLKSLLRTEYEFYEWIRTRLEQQSDEPMPKFDE